MNIFYNFDNMYNRKSIVSNNTKNIDENKAYVTEKNTTLNCIPNNKAADKSDDKFKPDKDIALFDYSAKASSRYLSKQSCSNVNCLEGLINQEVPDNCMDYNSCLQYFNTIPLMNCIDNVPTSTFLIVDTQ